MTRQRIRYGALACETATVLMALWLALGTVAAVAAASPACDGSCCRSLNESTQLRAPQRHCCSESATTFCNFNVSDAAAVKPAAISPLPLDPGRNFPPLSGFSAVDQAGPGGYAVHLPALLGGNQPDKPLYLQHKSLRR